VIRDPDQGVIGECVVFVTKPIIGAPMHTLGLAPVTAFQDATGLTHFVADRICPPRRTILQIFTLRRVDQPVAMAAQLALTCHFSRPFIGVAGYVACDTTFVLA
jgi:hypothetical protein